MLMMLLKINNVNKRTLSLGNSTLFEGAHRILLVLMVVFSYQLYAQNIADDLKKMNALNQKTDQIHAQLTVKIYASEEDKTPSITQHYEIKKKGQALYYKIDQNRMLMNSSCVLMINDKDKSVLYTKSTGQAVPEQNMMNINMDSLVKAYDSVQYKGTKNEQKHYVLHKKGSPIPTIEIYFDVNGTSISKLVYHYNKTMYPENNLVEINYTKWNYSPQFAADEFSEKKYVASVNNKLQLTAILKGYKLTINDY